MGELFIPSVCGTWGNILFQVLDMGDTQLV